MCVWVCAHVRKCFLLCFPCRITVLLILPHPHPPCPPAINNVVWGLTSVLLLIFAHIWFYSPFIRCVWFQVICLASWSSLVCCCVMLKIGPLHFVSSDSLPLLYFLLALLFPFLLFLFSLICTPFLVVSCLLWGILLELSTWNGVWDTD